MPVVGLDRVRAARRRRRFVREPAIGDVFPAYDLDVPPRLAPEEGAMFGVESLSWRLRTPLRFLGLPREILLQVARPEIADAIARNSDFESDPLARFARTIGVVATVRFGSPAESAATLRRLRDVHAPISGRGPGGDRYAANDPALQFWVLASIVDTTLTIERRYVGALSDEQREQYYAEQFAVFDAFGVSRVIVPPDFAEFERWFANEVRRLHVTDDARRIGTRVVNLSGIPVNRMVRALSRVVTADLLPAELREPYGLQPRVTTMRAIHQMQGAARPTLQASRQVKRRLPGHPGRLVHGRLEEWVVAKRRDVPATKGAN